MIWILNGLEARLTPFLLRMEGPTDRASGHTLVPANMRHLIAIASWKGVTKKVASMRCAYTWYRVYNILANTCVFNPRLELHIPYRIRLRAFKSALSMHSLSRITYLTLELSPHTYSTGSATLIIVMYSSGSKVPCMMPL